MLNLFICLYAYMPRTTINLDDKVYELLVKESIKRYGTTKAISKVINELLKKELKGDAALKRLLEKKKVVKISNKEFEEFRRELSKRFEL